MMQLGAGVHGDRETKKQPFFTGEKGKKKEQSKSLWSGDGLKYLKHAEKNRERYMRMIRRCE
jgi:hypothetical protein